MTDQTEAATDLLLGAEAISRELKTLGLIKEDDENALDKVYYWARRRRLPITHYGKHLLSTRSKLRSAIHALMRAAE
jgi:hypothetical protein